MKTFRRRHWNTTKNAFVAVFIRKNLREQRVMKTWRLTKGQSVQRWRTHLYICHIRRHHNSVVNACPFCGRFIYLNRASSNTHCYFVRDTIESRRLLRSPNGEKLLNINHRSQAMATTWETFVILIYIGPNARVGDNVRVCRTHNGTKSRGWTCLVRPPVLCGHPFSATPIVAWIVCNSNAPPVNNHLHKVTNDHINGTRGCHFPVCSTKTHRKPKFGQPSYG